MSANDLRVKMMFFTSLLTTAVFQLAFYMFIEIQYLIFLKPVTNVQTSRVSYFGYCCIPIPGGIIENFQNTSGLTLLFFIAIPVPVR